MRKALLSLFALILVLTSIIGLASCGKVEFKVDFIVDDEVYSIVNTNGEETIKIPENPTKEGYTFDGWYWDKDTWQKPFTANSLLDAPLSSDMSVYAKFTDENAVKGTEIELSGFEKKEDDSLGAVYYISVSKSKIVYSLNEVVTVNNKSKWTVSTDLSGNDTIASKTVELSVGNNIYYLMVEDEFSNVQQYILLIRRRPVYTVTYYQSILTVHSTETVEEGAFANPPTLTAPTGYHFGGWSYDFTNPITSNVDAGVVWAPNEYTLTYDANGGTVSIDTQDVKYGVNFTLTSTNRPGYTFDGWYNGSTKMTSGEWRYTSDVTAVAKWTPISYSITYYLDGGNNSSFNPSGYNTGDSVTLREPTKKGYTFLGWTYSGVTEPTKNVVIASGEYGNKAYTANWQANEYNLTFNADGGNCDTLEKTIVYDEYVTLPTANREGYEFLGWYNGTTEITSGYWKADSDVDLIAKWELIPYRITYTLNGGTNAANPESYNIITESFSLADPAREGYEFLGWTYEGQSTPTKLVSIEKGSKGDREFTANWQARSFTVGFDANGGECSQEPIEVTFDDYCELPVPTRAGHTFAGWYFDGKKYESGICKIADNVTLVAQWDIIDYSISYTLNGGANPTGNPTSYNILTGVTVTNPTRTGYTFLGWTYEGQSTPVKDLTFAKGTTEDKILVAHWEANNYEITLDADGGNVGSDKLDVTYDDTFVLPQPTRAGYTFTGWYNGNTKVTSGTWKTADNMTLKASWSIVTYSISYVMNGGVNSTSNPTTFTVVSGATVKNPTRTGYTFLGWTYSSVTTPTKDVTLSAGTIDSKVFTAHWQANEYTLTFNANGGNLESGSIPVTYDDNYSVSTPTRTGYIFKGWFDGNTQYSGGTWKVANDVTVVAEWEAKTYTITYNANGGSVSGTTQTVTFDKEFTLREPTRTGYTFLGWYNGEDKVISGVWTVDSGMSLKAEWQANSYAVTYDANGGTASHTGDTATYDSDFTLATAERVGYTFVGWYDGTKLYTDGTWKTANTVKLVAKWTANTDTKYVVNHHLQNIYDDGYTLDVEENLKGTSDSSVTPSVKTYTGFTSPSTKTIKIAPDGSLVVDYFYTRNYYTITLIKNGGNGTDIRQKYQSALYPQTWTDRDGFTFGGWFIDKNLITPFSETTMPSHDTTLYAYWTEENKPSDFSYSSSGVVNILEYKGNDSIVQIPAYINDIPVESISTNAFKEKNNIEQVVIPNTVVEIATYAFYNCPNMYSVIIPESIKIIGRYAFYTCPNLQFNVFHNGKYLGNASNPYHALIEVADKQILTLIAHDDTKTITSGLLSGCTKLSEIKVPFLGTHKEDTTRDFLGYFFGSSNAEKQEQGSGLIPSSLKTITITDDERIAPYAFRGCKYITNISFPNDISSIGKFAFYDCRSITEISIPDSITEIHERTFYYCMNLTHITIGTGVKSVGYYSFYPDTKKSVYISNVTQWCNISGLESSGIHTYGSTLYVNNQSATTLVIPSGVTSIPDSAFKWFTNIQTVLFDKDSQTTRIGRLAFWECTNITTISIPSSMLEINYSAFEHCKKLTKVFYHGTEAKWKNIFIDYCVYTNYIETATKYYLQDEPPTALGNFWYYDENGRPKIWD